MKEEAKRYLTKGDVAAALGMTKRGVEELIARPQDSFLRARASHGSLLLAGGGAGFGKIRTQGRWLGGTVKPLELLREVLRGRLLIVGEYRGSQAEKTGYVDRKTGQAIHYFRALHLLECACRGNLDRAIIYERPPGNHRDARRSHVPLFERGGGTRCFSCRV